MTTSDRVPRGSGWEAMQRSLAADAVVAEAVLYAAGGRRLTWALRLDRQRRRDPGKSPPWSSRPRPRRQQN